MGNDDDFFWEYLNLIILSQILVKREKKRQGKKQKMDPVTSSCDLDPDRKYFY